MPQPAAIAAAKALEVFSTPPRPVRAAPVQSAMGVIPFAQPARAACIDGFSFRDEGQ